MFCFACMQFIEKHFCFCIYKNTLKYDFHILLTKQKTKNLYFLKSLFFDKIVKYIFINDWHFLFD